MRELTTQEAARLLSLKPGTIASYVQTGKLRGRTINGRLVLVEAASVQEYREQRRPKGRPRSDEKT